MATPNNEELYTMALNAAKNKQFRPARMMLQQLISQDGKHTRAMMLMARLSNKNQRRDWLEKVLTIDPNHDEASEQLEKLDLGDTAKRNVFMLKVGLSVGAVLVLLIALLAIISAASASVV